MLYVCYVRPETLLCLSNLRKLHIMKQVPSATLSFFTLPCSTWTFPFFPLAFFLKRNVSKCRNKNTLLQLFSCLYCVLDLYFNAKFCFTLQEPKISEYNVDLKLTHDLELIFLEIHYYLLKFLLVPHHNLHQVFQACRRFFNYVSTSEPAFKVSPP